MQQEWRLADAYETVESCVNDSATTTPRLLALIRSAPSPSIATRTAMTPKEVVITCTDSTFGTPPS